MTYWSTREYFLTLLVSGSLDDSISLRLAVLAAVFSHLRPPYLNQRQPGSNNDNINHLNIHSYEGVNRIN